MMRHRSLISLDPDYDDVDLELDLHGCTTLEAKIMLDEAFESSVHTHIRIIVGKGTKSQFGAVLPSFVQNYLTDKKYRFHFASPEHGGEGAVEVYV